MNNPRRHFVLGALALQADGMWVLGERQGRMTPLLCALLSTLLWQQTLEEEIASTPPFY